GRGHLNRPVYQCKRCPPRARPTLDEAELLNLLWCDVVDFLSRPDDTLAAVARAEDDAGTEEDRAERAALEVAGLLREVDQREAKLLDTHLRALIDASIFEAAARQIKGERAALQRRLEAAKEARDAAIGKARASEGVKRLLDHLRDVARAAGEDP